MFFDSSTQRQIDYQLCRYGKSTLLFRGPRQRIDLRYVAFLGGTETYGKDIERPFPQIIESEISVPSLNLGCISGGLEIILQEPELLRLCNRADATVFQIPSALTVSNRFYSVRSRRNTIVKEVSQVLSALYSGSDLQKSQNVVSLLNQLKTESESRLSLILDELAETWTNRMREILRRIDNPTILLWLSTKEPEDPENYDLGTSEPLFVNREMLEELRGDVAAIVEVAPDLNSIDQSAHEEAAFTLAPIIERI